MKSIRKGSVSGNAKRSVRGFTLKEILVVVGILAVLVAVAVPSIIAIRRNLHITKLDTTARQIFVAAQNRLTSLKTSGELELVQSVAEGGAISGLLPIPKIPQDFPADLEFTLNYVYLTHTNAGMGELLPVGSIDDVVRGSGFYVIEYNQITGQVYGVFFSEDPFNYGTDCFKQDVRTDKSVRMNAGTNMVGYYGGSGLEEEASNKSLAPRIEIINRDVLEIRIYQHQAAESATEYTITVSNADDMDQTVTLPSFKSDERGFGFFQSPYVVSYDESAGCHVVLLDSLNPQEQFKDIFGSKISPGANLIIEVKAVQTDFTPVTVRNLPVVNSLFASAGIAPDNTASVFVAQARHLQNLDPSFSGIASTDGGNKIAVTSATQKLISSSEDTSMLLHSNEAAKGNITWTAGLSAFQPIDNPFLERFDGSGLQIIGLRIGRRSIGNVEYAGMFAILHEGTPQNGTRSVTGVRLVNPSYAEGVSANYAGMLAGLAGENANPSNWSINNCRVYREDGVTDGAVGVVNGSNYAGGLVGYSSGNISDCSVSGLTVICASNAGGIAGVNNGSIKMTGVEYSSVKSTSVSSAGGIAGLNTDSATVEDVYFLSTNDLGTNNVPVSDNGGGIVGSNSGVVTRAFYFAPAPQEVSDGGAKVTFYPIVRAGKPCVNNTCFYLMGSRYSLREGASGSWKSVMYNRGRSFITGVSETEYVVSGGGAGLVSEFIYKEWLTFAYGVNLNNWTQPARGYPYPVLSGGQAAVPVKWPVAASAVRPDQHEVDDWAEVEATSERTEDVGFMNGDFDENINGNPISEPSAEHMFFVSYPDYRVIPGWRTRLAYGASGQGSGAVVDSMELIYPNKQRADGSWMGIYSGNGPLWGLYNPGDSFGCVRTNYKGTETGVYAELNATTQNTLYQIASTEPGTAVVYSFYHATRHDYDSVDLNGNPRRNNHDPDLMNFYLSGVADFNDATAEVVYKSGSPMPTLIRPCATPRGNDETKITDADGVSVDPERCTRYPVAYGLVSSFYNSLTNVFMEDKYLYDVWIYDDLNNDEGYGVTIWSDEPLVGENGGARLNLSPEELNWQKIVSEGLQDNIIGYWDAVRFTDGPNAGLISQWKQYYGEYTVPEEQEKTEFAFESRTSMPSEGNFLDGITFKSSPFLSIEQYIKLGDIDVHFVKPDDVLTVELHVKSWGETAARGIVIKDQLFPFSDYVGFVEGSVAVEKVGGGIISCAIDNPDEDNSYTLSISLPGSTELKMDEELLITFQLQVKTLVKDTEEISTLLYYFENQCVVEYRDAEFKAYAVEPRRNYTSVLHVSIDPIRLTKTVENLNGEAAIDGPFKVSLTVENTLEESLRTIITTGLITDIIPAGFRVVGDVVCETSTGLGTTTVTDILPDGSSRITISNVNLSQDVKEITFSYTLEYTGSGYGVSYIHRTSGYRYLYSEASEEPVSVILNFPQPVVGISAKPQGDEFEVAAGATSSIEILRSFRFGSRMFDANYDVTPEVVLTDSLGNPFSKNADGYYEIKDTDYTAILQPGNTVLFTPRAGFTGEIVLYYKIELTATKPGAASFELSSGVTEVKVTIR